VIACGPTNSRPAVQLLMTSLRTGDETHTVRFNDSRRYLEFLKQIVCVNGTTMDMNASQLPPPPCFAVLFLLSPVRSASLRPARMLSD
jgi:hypothetical protein